MLERKVFGLVVLVGIFAGIVGIVFTNLLHVIQHFYLLVTNDFELLGVGRSAGERAKRRVLGRCWLVVLWAVLAGC